MVPGNRVTSAASSTSVLADPPVIRAFRHRFFVWIALLAMLMSALAPAISRAMGPDEHGRYFIEVCSAEGTKRVALSVDEAAFYGAHTTPADDGGDGRALDECAYCSAPYSTAMLPPGDPTPVFAVAGAQSVPPLFLVSPRPLFAWSPAHPRAPPSRA
jgi:hypothetical protein